MTRTSFEIMPTDGPRDNRQTSRVINQAMTGKQNCVRDFSIDQTELKAGTVTLKDSRISAQSFLAFDAQNLAAELAADDIISGVPRKGEIDVGQINTSLQEGYATATADDIITQAIGTTPSNLELEGQFTGSALKNMTIQTGAIGSITSQVAGNFNVSFSGSGAPGANVNVDVGLIVDLDGTATTVTNAFVELARTNIRFAWGISFTVVLQTGGIIYPAMFYNSISTLDDASYVLSASKLGGTGGLPIDTDPNDDLGLGLNEDLQYRVLIIG